MYTTTAAVSRAAGEPFDLQQVVLDDLRSDEVLVRIVAVGICHTDVSASRGVIPFPLPRVLGHEGAGRIVAVGAGVDDVRIGDAVLLSFTSCGTCGSCIDGHPAYCVHHLEWNLLGGTRADGSSTLQSDQGALSAHFFGQSSFAQLAIADWRCVVRLPESVTDSDLALLAPLGCGFQTGAGAVLNVLRPAITSTLVITGAGAVGLAAVMAARTVPVDQIIVVDRVVERLALAKELGATDVIDTSVESLSQRIGEFTGGLGVDAAIETTGSTAVLDDLIGSIAIGGSCLVIGAPAAGSRAGFDVNALLPGRKIIGVTLGDSDPATFIPRLMRLHDAGAFPIERLIRCYPFEDINRAVEDSRAGRTIKPVLVMKRSIDMSTIIVAATTPVISPVTGEAILDVPAFTPAEARAAVDASAAAQLGWAASSYLVRRRVLLDAADILEGDLESHVGTFALEIGATRAWAEMNVREAASTLREAAGLTSGPIGTLLPSHDPSTVNHSLRGPAGVTLAIVPWNAPLILAARASAISLAVGNSVIVRTSDESPLTAGRILADALHRGGLPEDAMIVVTTAPGQGRDAITELISSPDVRRVAFIGSTPVGRSIARTAGEAFTPVALELGGKNVTIVRSDADIERWAPVLAFASFANSGQVCMCTDRILVHESLHDVLVTRLAEIAGAAVVGDPRKHDVDFGPLINEKAAAHFSALVDDARLHGAAVVAGGTRDGLYARPTVLTDVTSACRFDVEEGFAPIVSVTPFSGDDEAVALANQGEFGLIASVISADEHRAYSMARRLRAGAVHVNGPSVGDEPHVPFGGLGASGFGRLGGEESVRFFTEQQTLYVHS